MAILSWKWPVTSYPSHFSRNARTPHDWQPIGPKLCVGSSFDPSSHHTKFCLKCTRASRSCPRQVPSDNVKVCQMSHERARRPAPGSKAAPKPRVQIAQNFERMFLYPRNVPTQNFSPMGAPHRRPFQLEILPITSKPSQFFRNAVWEEHPLKRA